MQDPGQPVQISFFQCYFSGDVATTVQMVYSQPRHDTSSSKTYQPGSFKTPKGEAIYENLKLSVSNLF